MTAQEGRVEGLLHAMRADLRRGDYAGLEAHAEELKASMADLALLPKPVLARILREAEGNAACLSAAMKGLRVGRQRLEEIRSASRGAAYDALGRRQVLDGTDRRLTIGSNSPDFGMPDQERINPRRV